MLIRRSQSSISISWKPIFYESDFLKKNLFSELNSLILSSPERQTIDFQHKINFKLALKLSQKEVKNEKIKCINQI